HGAPPRVTKCDAMVMGRAWRLPWREGRAAPDGAGRSKAKRMDDLRVYGYAGGSHLGRGQHDAMQEVRPPDMGRHMASSWRTRPAGSIWSAQEQQKLL